MMEGMAVSASFINEQSKVRRGKVWLDPPERVAPKAKLEK